MSATDGGKLPPAGEQPPDAGGESSGGDQEGSGRANDAGAFVAAERARRLSKLDSLRRRGIDPYPVRFDRTCTLGELRERFAHLEPGQETGETVRVAGRAMLIRHHGKLSFADLRDRTGNVQLFVSRQELGAQAFADFEDLDLGDWVGAEGTVMTTKTGELSVRVRSFQLLAKSLRGLPSKGHGLTDVDTRYRQRYLDLIVNPQERRTFEIRFKTIASIRRTLSEQGFVEVETPVLDAAAGGAAARPFITHHNALDIDLYMRIALELPLKRLVVGGMERVFEIGRVFRNEGLDTRHNPEFTLLEAYAAFWDYHDVMDLVELLASKAAEDALGTTEIEVEGRTIDLAPPWRRVPMREAIREHAGVDMHPSMPVEQATEIATRFGIPIESGWGSGRLMNEVYDATCEAKLIEPTFVIDHPREVSPLARTHRDDPLLVERFEAVIAGRELANAYSELNDPVDQRERFEAEARAKAAGDEQAEDLDEDYIRALEYGLPPTGGLGIGVDRLVMLLAGASSIREVILFPTMRPEEGRGRRPAHGLAAAGALPTPQELSEAALAADEAEPEAPDDGAAESVRAAAGEAPAGGSPRAALLTPPRPQEGAARHLGWLTGLAGLASLLPNLPVLSQRLSVHPLLSRPDRAATYVVAVVVGLGLLFVARQLAHQKHRALQAAVALFGIGALAHVLKGPHLVAAAVDAAMLVALVRWRRAFFARGDPHSPLAALRFLPMYVGAVLVFGFAALLLERHRIEPPLSLGGGLRTILGGLAGYRGPYGYESRLFADFFETALLTMGVCGLAALAFLLFRPLVSRTGPTERDRARARELVHRYGGDTLAYFALRRDKSYFFSRDGRAMIAYAYTSGYALASGDPIGARGAIPAVMDEFLAFCRDRAWRVAFLSVREADADLYRQRGLRNIYLGDEAIIRCDTFNLAGSAMKSVRSAVKHVERDHRFTLIRESDASPELVERLNRISEEWRGKEPERGFTMKLDREVEGREPDFLLALCLDADGRPVGFLRLVPCYGRDPGYSLDLMRRVPDAPNGVSEFLIANTALTLGAGGFRRLSMNFAAWGRLFGEGARLSAWERVERAIATTLNPFFQIRTLRDFNQKFAPEWEPRSIVVEDPGALPKVGLLFASVEGFVRFPVIGRYLVPQAPTGKAGA